MAAQVLPARRPARPFLVRGALALAVGLFASPAAAQWTHVDAVPAQPVIAVRSFGDTLVAGTQSLAYVSTDAGTTWHPSGALPQGVSFVQSLLVRNGVLYAGTAGGGVFVSPDLGLTWQAFNQGLVGGLFDSQLDVSDLVTRGDSLYAATLGAGVYVRNLGAADSWHHFGDVFEPEQASNVRGLAVGGTRILAAAGGNGTVFFRDPGDADWTESFLDNVGLHPGLQAFNAVWTGTGWVVGTGTGQWVFPSAHGQEPWAAVNLGLGLFSSAALATRGHYVFGAFNRTLDAVVAHSGDDGLTWQVLDVLPGAFVFGMATDGGDLYAARGDGLFRRSVATVAVGGDGASPALQLAVAGAQPIARELRLRFALPAGGDATLDVFAVNGRRVARFAEPALAAGPHELAWDAGGLAPGVYLVRLVAGDRRATTRFVRVR